MSAMADLRALLAGGSVDQLDSPRIVEMLRFVATDESASIDVIDSFSQEELGAALHNLLQNAADTAIEPRIRKGFLKLVCNLGNRSKRVFKSIRADSLTFLLKLLREPELLAETAAVMTIYGHTMHTSLSLVPEYDVLIGAAAVMWVQCESDDERSWLSAFFGGPLQNDGAFLANCFGDMPMSTFTALLHVVDALTSGSTEEVDEGVDDNDDEGGRIQLHPNNVQLLVDLLERILFDCVEDEEKREKAETPHFTSPAKEAEEQRQQERLAEYPEILPVLLDCIASCAIRRRDFADQLHCSTAPVTNAVRILELSLHASGLVVRPPPIVSRADDRPLDAPVFKSERVEKCPGLRRLLAMMMEEGTKEGGEQRQRRPAGNGSASRAVPLPEAGGDGPGPSSSSSHERLPSSSHEDVHLQKDGKGASLSSEAAAHRRMLSRLAALKQAAVSAIGNLSADSPSNRVAAGEEGAVVLCLAATKREEWDEPLLTQWAIFALRNLCIGCRENQEILANIEASPTGIVDREGLLANMGMRAEEFEDTNGRKRVKLVPLGNYERAFVHG